MGELTDEHEPVVEEIVRLDEHTYLLDGSVLVEDLNEKLHLKLQTENYDTLSGYLIEKLDYIPADEKVEPILVGNSEFTLLEVKDKRIRKVRLHITGK